MTGDKRRIKELIVTRSATVTDNMNVLCKQMVACHIHARWTRDLRSPAVSHGHAEGLPTWVCAG